MTTTEFFQKFLATKTLKPTTRLSYQYHFGRFQEFFNDSLPTTRGQVTEWITWLASNKHLADSSVHSAYITMKSMFNHMSMYDITNPFTNTKAPKVARKQHRIFTPDQLTLLITNCNDNDIEKLLIMAYVDSSCRASDMCHLRPADLDDTGFSAPESKGGQVHYRLDPFIINSLRNYANMNNIAPTQYIFTYHKFGKGGTASLHGDMMKPNSMTTWVRRILKRAGFTGAKLGAHTIRHSVASLIAKETGSPLAVKGILQHANITTSMLYIHEVEEAKAQETSPLKLVANSITQSGKHSDNLKRTLMLTDGTTAIVPINEQRSTIDEIITSAFSEIPDDLTKIRPLFSKNNLELIRRALICLCQYGEILTDGAEARSLWRRMTRKS